MHAGKVQKDGDFEQSDQERPYWEGKTQEISEEGKEGAMWIYGEEHSMQMEPLVPRPEAGELLAYLKNNKGANTAGED